MFAHNNQLHIFIINTVCKMTCFSYLFTNTRFLTGQLSSFEMSAITFPLSLFSLPQSYRRCSPVCVPLAQGHSGHSIIFNRCKCDVTFPCAAATAVKLGVKVFFIFRLSLNFGKTSLVTVRFVVLS